MNISPDFALLNIDKPLGLTSHDVVAIMRRETRIKKIGHAGTLDPLATGVLMLCLGQATRLSEYVMGHPKTYEAQVQLGIETTTYDAEGEIVATNDKLISREQFEAVLPQFQGDILQVPPLYSAIKQGGKKLYEIARRGEGDTVELTPRSVSIYDLQIVEWNFPVALVRVHCSPGTYIRSLAFDIGRALGVGGHLAGLRRVASGLFSTENAVSLETLREAIHQDTWQQYLLPPEMALQTFTRLDLNDQQSRAVQNGVWLDLTEYSLDTAELLQAYDDGGKFLAILAPVAEQPGRWKPLKVFNR
ncbi:MAG: tRNA pseudouridine(55) synthase TruB [Chloroflexi bacterium]|nr:tRNA pseudouridine(55) synthase TruB [Chloroflexota bacterium]